MTEAGQTDAGDRLDPRLRRTISALVIGGFASIVDSTIVSIGLHSLVRDLDSTVGTIQWVSTGYLLAYASAIPLVGWASVRFGARHTWLVALAAFGVFSVACALAWNDMSLIAFRVLQGMAGGLIMPLMQTIAMGAAHGKAIARVSATMSVPMALGPIIGPTLGGLILAGLDWRWMFLVNVPVVLVGLVLAVKWIDPDPPAAERARPALDAVGLILLAGGLVGLLYGLSRVGVEGRVTAPEVWLPALIGLVLLVGFVTWSSRRGKAAIVRIATLRRGSVGVACLAYGAAGGCLVSGMFLLPLFFQVIQGVGVLQAALMLIPQGVAALLIRLRAGAWTERFGSRTVTAAAFVVVFIGTIPFVFADAATSPWLLAAILFVRGLGTGTMMIPISTAAFVGVESRDIADASILTRISQQVGGSFGTAILAVVADRIGADPSTAYTQAFIVLAGFAIVGLLVSALLPGRPDGGRVPTHPHLLFTATSGDPDDRHVGEPGGSGVPPRPVSGVAAFVARSRSSVNRRSSV